MLHSSHGMKQSFMVYINITIQKIVNEEDHRNKMIDTDVKEKTV